MLTTEKDARKKWCPLARASDLGATPVAVNRASKKPDADCACIASDCMAWRWGPLVSEKDGALHAGHILGGTPLDLGFCGAFGHPAGAADAD